MYGVSFGTEHEVDVRSDTLSNHILVSQKSVAVVILHNHPSTQTFSIQDIQFFIEFSTLEIMVVVSNQGTVHYLMRENGYDLKKATALFKECIENLKKDSPLTEVYLAALSFLAKSIEKNKAIIERARESRKRRLQKLYYFQKELLRLEDVYTDI